MDHALSSATPMNLPQEVDLAAEIAALAPWTQNLRLPDGTQTAPDREDANRAAVQWEQIRDFLPADLGGLSALVINCNAGYHAIELARRGAHVSAIDLHPHFLRQAMWVAAKNGLTHEITFYRGHVHDLAHWRGRADVVLWFDGLHRLRYPLLALDIVSELTQRCLVVGLPVDSCDVPSQTFDSPVQPDAALALEVDEVPEPASSFLVNDDAVTAIIRSAGLDLVEQPGPGICLCQPQQKKLSTPIWHRQEFLAATGNMPSGLHRVDDDISLPLGAIAPLTSATS